MTPVTPSRSSPRAAPVPAGDNRGLSSCPQTAPGLGLHQQLFAGTRHRLFAPSTGGLSGVCAGPGLDTGSPHDSGCSLFPVPKAKAPGDGRKPSDRSPGHPGQVCPSWGDKEQLPTPAMAPRGPRPSPEPLPSPAQPLPIGPAGSITARGVFNRGTPSAPSLTSAGRRAGR